MERDHESTDLEGAAHLAADEAIPDPPPDPSEYAEPYPLDFFADPVKYAAAHFKPDRDPWDES